MTAKRRTVVEPPPAYPMATTSSPCTECAMTISAPVSPQLWPDAERRALYVWRERVGHGDCDGTWWRLVPLFTVYSAPPPRPSAFARVRARWRRRPWWRPSDREAS